MSRMISKKTDFYTSMAWEDISCELCKTKFPDYVRVKGKPSKLNDNFAYDEGDDQIIQLIDINDESLNCPYLMLDCINVSSFK